MNRAHALAATALLLITLLPTASALHEGPPTVPCEWDGEEPTDVVLDRALLFGCAVLIIGLQVVGDAVGGIGDRVWPLYDAAAIICYATFGPNCVL